ncbi:hypothetical protein B0T18DRAFT_409060 [Schizothecium vesticola]|uniref:Uncharacterized protein n=1 Tax=Schizothecium vesticola TaxID=314040 RepID=A0AA40F3I7_9PEZI|nr:hypothetical protein B0T18DRAFT_409060 [Schizothecium vesticola]
MVIPCICRPWPLPHCGGDGTGERSYSRPIMRGIFFSTWTRFEFWRLFPLLLLKDGVKSVPWELVSLLSGSSVVYSWQGRRYIRSPVSVLGLVEGELRGNMLDRSSSCESSRTPSSVWDSKKGQKHTTPGIRWSSPTQLLIRRLLACLWESERDPEFPSTCGRMWLGDCDISLKWLPSIMG